jgi:hypothetical protein
LAELFDVPVQEMIAQTKKNTVSLFGL